MKYAASDRLRVGTEIIGPDGEVYFVPDRVQAAFRVPASPSPGTMPKPDNVSADISIGKAVQQNQAYLPQLPAGMC